MATKDQGQALKRRDALNNYNSEKYISDCLKSCITQTYKNLEIIVVNDGSTDNTSQIIKEYTH